MKPDKRPKRTNGFSWGRITLANGWTEYRLFRREASGRLHPPQSLIVHAGEDRRMTAKALRVVYRRLRDQVDEIDLSMMETTN
jgi:hypothetical protein